MHKDKLIYIVDDEPAICQLVGDELMRFGYRVRTFGSGAAISLAMQQAKPDLCIVDLGLPDMDGLALIGQLQQAGDIGVIILSGRSSLPDRVLGLEVGADDFICKPFDPRELVARANSLVRRLQKGEKSSDEADNSAYFDGWCFEPSTLSLHRDGGDDGLAAQILSAAEAELLMLLLKSPKRILTRDQLLSAREHAYDRCIDVRMSRIRKKIEADPKSPRLIKTVYGAGYMLTCDVQWR